MTSALQNTGYGDAVNSKPGGTFTKNVVVADREFLKDIESILAPPYRIPTEIVEDETTGISLTLPGR